MKLAVVVGGWHWPMHFYRKMAEYATGADLFVISHRNPELPIVREEKRVALDGLSGPLIALDRILYHDFPTIDALIHDGWAYHPAPNTIGDWGFFNQWLDAFDYTKYDVILNCHDDTYLRREGLFNLVNVNSPWLLMSNGTYPGAPGAYVRGSFEFWKKELLDMLGGRIDLGDVKLTREGLTDSPAAMEALFPWNDSAVPLRRFMMEHGVSWKVSSLSPYYRVSPWVIEGERGFMHSNVGVPWSFENGLVEYPL